MHSYSVSNRFSLRKSLYALSFYRSQNVLCRSKNLIPFSVSSNTFVPAQKPNLLNANHLLVWHKMFGIGTKCISIFGLAQNILEPVEGQGIRVFTNPNFGPFYFSSLVDSVSCGALDLKPREYGWKISL